MNLKFSRLVIFILTLLYLSNFVNAEFGVNSEKTLLKICRCSQLEDNIKIKNTGSESTIYQLSSNRDFVVINPSEFELLPGKIQDIQLIINAPCKTLRKDLKIRIRSNKGDDEKLVKQLITGQCQNLRTKLFVDKSEVNPCKDVNYNLLIENTGSFTEKYSIFSNIDEYLNLSSIREIELNAGESIKVNGVLTLPCEMYGEVPVTFLVSAEKNNLQSSLKHDLVVNQYYSYSLEVTEENKFCEEDFELINVKIENDVETPNSFFLELDGEPSFIRLSSNNIYLEGKEKTSVNITLDVKEGKNIGYYDFTLKTWTGYGDISQEKNISVNISDCYKPEIKLLEKNLDFCTEEKSVIVNVKNNGERKEKITLIAEPEIAEFEKNSVLLDPDREVNVTLFLKPEDKSTVYDVKVKAVLDNNISVIDDTKVNVLSNEECHYVELWKRRFSIRRDTENNALIKLKNKGRTEETYSLGLNPHFWVTLEKNEITIQPGKTARVLLLSNHTQETAFGDYPVNLSVKLGDLEYVKSFVVSLKDKPLYVKAYIYFSQRPCQAATTILFAVIMILFILSFVLKKNRGKLRRKPFFVSVAVLVALLAIFAVLIYSYKGLPLLNEPIDYSKASSVHYIWSQDKTFEFDLSSFVSDPDSGDDLNLSFIEDQEEISLSVENGKVVFSPKEGWYGIKKVVLMAVDSKGASAESPEITLEVVKWNKYSFWTAYEKLCWYFNWILLLIVFLLLSFIGFKKLRWKSLVLKKNKKSVKERKRS